MTETAKMYGGSLYDLAAEEGLETRILGELDEVQQLLKQNPDYLRLLSTPSIPKKERCGLLDEALRGQVHLYVLNFLKKLNNEGNTIVMITHDNSIAMEAKRVVRIADGKINFDGDVKDYASIIQAGSKEHMGQ